MLIKLTPAKGLRTKGQKRVLADDETSESFHSTNESTNEEVQIVEDEDENLMLSWQTKRQQLQSSTFSVYVKTFELDINSSAINQVLLT
jgi:hypothetical protein